MALIPVQHFLVDSNHIFLRSYLSHRHHPLSIPASISKPRARPMPATTISSQDSSSQPPKPPINDDPTTPLVELTSPSAPSRSKKPNSPGQGFGSSDPVRLNPGPSSSKKKQKGGRGDGRERASVIRRSPVEKPVFLGMKDDMEAKERTQNESAFLLVWVGLGGLIVVEGILLAASGLLPEQWDKFFVKYLYPSFTPTVAVFVAGTVAYGVWKYLQNENAKTQK